MIYLLSNKLTTVCGSWFSFEPLSLSKSLTLEHSICDHIPYEVR